MDDDERGYPPGEPPAADSRYPFCTRPDVCGEIMAWNQDMRPKNDWYDHDMCTAEGSDVPTVAEALIQTSTER